MGGRQEDIPLLTASFVGRAPHARVADRNAMRSSRRDDPIPYLGRQRPRKSSPLHQRFGDVRGVAPARDRRQVSKPLHVATAAQHPPDGLSGAVGVNPRTAVTSDDSTCPALCRPGSLRFSLVVANQPRAANESRRGGIVPGIEPVVLSAQPFPQTRLDVQDRRRTRPLIRAEN